MRATDEWTRRHKRIGKKKYLKNARKNNEQYFLKEKEAKLFEER